MRTELNFPVYDLERSKGARNMARKMTNHLAGRFDIQFSGRAMNFSGRDFAEVSCSSDSNFVAFTSTGNGRVGESQKINFIAGMCLFGADNLTGIDERGSRISLTDPYSPDPLGLITDISDNPFPHPSEIESILRTTGAISGLAESDISLQYDKLFFHLPIPEYFMYLLDRVERGQLESHLADFTSDTIIGRGNQIANILARRIPEHIEVIFTSPLNDLGQLILDSQFTTTLDEVVRFLYETDDLMARLLDFHPPSCFGDINYLSYTHLYHEVNALSVLEESACLAVEESKESRILTETKKQSQELGIDLAMGVIYVAPKIISRRGLHNLNDLFMHDTSNDSMLNQLKSVVRAYKGGT